MAPPYPSHHYHPYLICCPIRIRHAGLLRQEVIWNSITVPMEPQQSKLTDFGFLYLQFQFKQFVCLVTMFRLIKLQSNG